MAANENQITPDVSRLGGEVADLLIELSHREPVSASRHIRQFCDSIRMSLENAGMDQEGAILSLELEAVLRRMRGLPQA